MTSYPDPRLSTGSFMRYGPILPAPSLLTILPRYLLFYSVFTYLSMVMITMNKSEEDLNIPCILVKERYIT